MSTQRLMIDLFSGLGGASAAFRERGWRVVTLDNDPMFKPDILLDIREFSPVKIGRFPRPDFVWASPPCVEFARRRFDARIDPSLELVRHAKRVIDELNPRCWALENVRLSVPYINEILGPTRMTVGAFFLWGTFPKFLASPIANKGAPKGPHKMRSAIRAKIPGPLSADMERAVSYGLRAEESGGFPGAENGWQLAMPGLEPAAWPFPGPGAEPGAGRGTDPAGAAGDGPASRPS